MHLRRTFGFSRWAGPMFPLLLLAAAAPGQSVYIEDVSRTAAGRGTDGAYSSPRISTNGRYVAFYSTATNLIHGDPGAGIFVKDRETGAVQRVTRDADCPQCESSDRFTLSGDGRFVAFYMSDRRRPNPDGHFPPPGPIYDAFVKDRETGVLERVSVTPTGEVGNDSSGGDFIRWDGVFTESEPPTLSADGRFIAFQSRATNLVPDDTNGQIDVFLKDRATGAVERISISETGPEGDNTSANPFVSADGRFVAFESTATNLIPGETNTGVAAYLKDRQTGTLERASRTWLGERTSGWSPKVSEDGRYVTFLSRAGGIIPGPDGQPEDYNLYRRDRQTGEVLRAAPRQTNILFYYSISPDGRFATFTGTVNSPDRLIHVKNWQTGTLEAINPLPMEDGFNEPSGAFPSISGDGRFVAFVGEPGDYAPPALGETATSKIYVADRAQPQPEPPPTPSMEIERISITATGQEGNSESRNPDITADGRYVVFQTPSQTLMVNTNGINNIYLKDRQTKVLEMISILGSGEQANGDSTVPTISDDGRFVAFQSDATNLVPDDANGMTDIFVKDRQTGQFERVSVSAEGVQGNATSYNPALSADGRFVAFVSQSTNLVGSDTNGYHDVFVKDRQTGAVELVSVTATGEQGNGLSGQTTPLQISEDGRFILFISHATNFDPADTSQVLSYFLKDRLTGSLERAPAATTLPEPFLSPRMSADGRFIAFATEDGSLVAGDTNTFSDVFVQEVSSDAVERVSVSPTGQEGNGDSTAGSLNEDGRYVAFKSYATNLDPSNPDWRWWVHKTYIKDRQTEAVARQDERTGGMLSGNGQYLVFVSEADDLVTGDTNERTDIFVARTILPAAPVPGDLNGDGERTVADVTLGLRFFLGVAAPTPEQVERGDFDEDGAITATDLNRLMRLLVGLDN